MKKYILIGVILTLMIASTVNAQLDENASQVEKNILEQKASAFTHTVLAEETTATWCPNCPMAAEALYNIYDSGDYPFYYISLINDMNPIAKKRNGQFSITGIIAFPTVYFDGGDTNFVGRGNSVQETEAEYRTLIEQEGQRTPKQPITMDSSVTWDGNAKITVTITITNEGKLPYLGKLRSFVTEIESRWDDNAGNPYHFGFLDYAYKRFILLMPGKTKTITGTFDGNADHGGQTYPDITSDNIMVISAIYHWIPRYRTGYESGQYKQFYFARLVDQATAAVPT